MCAELERGRSGRLFNVRLSSNDDVVGSIEELCARNGVEHAFVRGGLGSLFRARLQPGEDADLTIQVEGFAVEILTLGGEVRRDENGWPRARIDGVLADNQGRVFSGRILHGEAPTCVTVELVVQEWLRIGIPGDGV